MQQHLDQGSEAPADSLQSQKPDQSDALKEALAEHEMMFDNAIAGIAKVQDRVITCCNRRFEEIFGYEPGELNNQNIRILYRSDDEYERIGRTGYGYMRTHSSYSDERVMKRKNGDTFWCTADLKPLDPDNPRHSALVILQEFTRHFEDAIKLALVTCGKAILFTALLMTIGIVPWYFLSELKFLSDMGLLLVVVMTINMILALILVPLLVYLFQPKFVSSEHHLLSESVEGLLDTPAHIAANQADA